MSLQPNFSSFLYLSELFGHFTFSLIVRTTEVIKNTEFLMVDHLISKLTQQRMRYFHKMITFELHNYRLKKVDENAESDVEDPFI